MSVTAVKCRAKDPSTCRVHGSKKLGVTAGTVYQFGVYHEQRSRIKNIQNVITEKAGTEELDYAKFSELQQQIAEAKWIQQLSPNGYAEVLKNANFNPTFENKFKLEQVEEAREALLAEAPVAHEMVTNFHNVVANHGLVTIDPHEAVDYGKKFKEVQSYVNGLPVGTKIAVEFFDGSYFVVTQEEPASAWKVLTGKEASKDLLASPYNPSFRLPGSGMLTNFLDMKKLTVLDDKVWDVFESDGVQEKLAVDSATRPGYLLAKNSHLEGVFYFSKPMTFSNGKKHYYTSGSNVYDFADDVVLTRLS